MTLRPILIHPDPRLKTVCKPVTDITDDIRRLADDMLATMYDAPGIGLAAPQVGVLGRMLVMDCVKGEDEAPKPMVLINPEVVWSSDERSTYNEGCLSIPDLAFDTPRARRVVAKGVDMHGEPVVIEGSDLLARAIQHETDHLDGILFIDRLDAETRKAAMKAIRESEWFGEPAPEVRISPHTVSAKWL